MSNRPLTVPEGYFEQSCAETLRRARAIRSRRQAMLAFCLVAVVTVGAGLAYQRLSYSAAERDYLAQQEELSRLDIFMEINQL